MRSQCKILASFRHITPENGTIVPATNETAENPSPSEKKLPDPSPSLVVSYPEP